MPSHELSAACAADQIGFLLNAEPEIEGRMPWSSNATFLVTLRMNDVAQRAIYKPVRGERPLSDFEPGLHKRERAAYLLSEHLGIGAVPPTVIRDGPHGTGSFQLFVDADHSEHYFTIYEKFESLHNQLREIALFDILANNTDRKSGHCLLAHDRVWAIDHGLCFSAPFRLRTVIWEFAGQPIEPALLDLVGGLADRIPLAIAALLSEDENAALSHRATQLADQRSYPTDPTGRRYPWPLV